MITNNAIIKKDLLKIHSQLKPLVDDFRNKKIFITGGTGFFGKWMVLALNHLNTQEKLKLKITILSRDSETIKKLYPEIYSKPNIDFVDGDVTTFKFPSRKYDYIIHAATDFHLDCTPENQLKIFETIVDGTKHVLDFAVHCEATKMLYISSGGVYKKPTHPNYSIEETTELLTDNASISSAYSLGKINAEFLCHLYSQNHKLEIKIARCFAFVGPLMPLDKHFAIGNFIQNFLNKQPITISSDGSALRSYMYMSDFVVWNFTILIKGKNCYPYNVGSDINMPIKNVAYIFHTMSDKNLPLLILQRKKKNAVIDNYIPSTKRARRELGLKVKVGLYAAIKKTIQYYSKKK